MKKKFFIYAMSAMQQDAIRGGTVTKATCGWVIATSKAEADGYAIAASKARYPEEQRFYNHSAVSTEVDIAQVQQAMR